MGSEPDWVTELMEERRKREDRAAKRAMRRRQSNEQLWIALAGDHLPEMLTSQQETEKYLQHDSWKLRLAAISILRTLWGASPEMAKTCGKMAFDDPNVQVRAAALFILACCYSGTNDPSLGNRLRRIVLDETLPHTFRRAAYSGLFQLRGTRARLIPMPGTYRFPEDVDWGFVESFNQGAKGKEQ